MDPNDEMSMDPGPRDPSVLHLQSEHRSDAVWKAGGGDCQRSRKRDPNQERFPKLHKRMIPFLLDLRFDGVTRLASIDLDWGLFTAIKEHWRSKTHTFHLPVGECSITLQDVTVLLGLKIDGDVMTGGTQVDGGWNNLVKQTFGIDTGKSLKGARLQLSWLTSNFKSLSDDASDVDVIRYTQSYLLQLFVWVLFTDHSGGQIHCMYLSLIQDFGRCRTLAWGSAVLAFLYRDLCKACRIGMEENAGCLILLQLWAWPRLPTLAHVPRGPSLDNQLVWEDQPCPYGMRWCYHLSFTDTTSHTLSAIRLSLDGLAPSHFIWQPYSNEPHMPNRCIRQFGFIQDIPPNDTYSKELHSITLQVSGTIGVGVTAAYDQWYARITHLYHTRVGGSHLFAVQLLDRISLVARGVIDGDMTYIDSIASNGRELLQDQFTRGVFEDFPIEDRRQKEIELKKKPKKTGHKGGRGGVNAPPKQGIDVNDDGGVHLDEEGGNNVGDDGDIRLGDEGGFAGEKNTHIDEQETKTRAETRVLSSMDYCPKFNLLPSNDSILFTPLSPQKSDVHEEQAANAHSPPLSHPTFSLGISQSPLPYQPVQEPLLDQPGQNQLLQQQSVQPQSVQK